MRRNGNYAQPGGPAGPHQPVAGIGHQRRSRIGHQRGRTARLKMPQHFRLLLGLVVIMKTDKTPHGNAALRAEQPRATRILGQHEIGLGQRLTRAGRKITRVAKRRCDDPQHAARRRSGRHRAYAPR